MTEPAETPALDRGRRVRKVLWVILWLNLAVAVAKAIYAWWAGSLAVATDSMHSFLDASANVIGLIALRFANEPPDPEHPYGHRKFEIVAALGIGVVVAAGAFQFGKGAVEALLAGESTVQTPAVGFVVIGSTWLINMFVAAFEAREGKRLNSPLLLADAGHTASDVVVTAAVMVSLLAARLGLGWADAAGALFVLVIVAKVAWSIVASNLGVLVDRYAVDPERVREVALSVGGVAGCHRVRSRGAAGHAHVDLHLQLRGATPLARAHDIAHDVEDRIKRELPEIVDVTIHMEPDDDDDEEL